MRLQNKSDVIEALKVQKLVLQGFEAKFSGSGLTNEQLKELLFYLWTDKDSKNQQYVIANDDDILGTMLLKRENIKEQLDVSLFTLWKKFGLIKTLKLIEILEVLSHEVSEDEVYIDHIVVSQHARGQHLGTELIKAAKKTLTGNEYLSLFVAKSNSRALALYERLGFKIVEVVRDIKKGKAVGEVDWFYMTYQKKHEMNHA